MKTSGIKLKLAAALAPFALAAGMFAPVAAAKQPPAATDGAVQLGHVRLADNVTRGFDVWNYTSHPIKLVSLTNVAEISGKAPQLGSVLKPGEEHHFEITYMFGGTSDVQANYETEGDSGSTFTAEMGVGALDIPHGYCSTSGGHTCTPSPGNWTDWGTTIAFVDRPN